MKLFYFFYLIIASLLPYSINAQTDINDLQIAFLADVHLQDLYGSFSDNNYKGIINPKNGKPVLLRTMESQLHSTRIFNENYFAFLSALDDIAKRGIHLVALPGDYTDDGQPIHLRGLQHILNEYTRKYGIEFFITTGNHDPVGPFAQPAGKNDFLGLGGKQQAIFSQSNIYRSSKDELPIVITKDIAKMGYDDITEYLKNFGFFPKENYRYWATPFSSYTPEDYSYSEAINKSAISNRMYEVAPGYTVPDVTYIVEPVDGLWLLALDGNVYIPKSNSNGDSKNPKNYSGADLGYNNVLTNKKHLINWVKKVAEEAEKKGKILIAFSHYPMVDFNDDASNEIEAFMGRGKWQLERVPEEEVAKTFADAGIKIHFGGHMHINDTGIRTYKSGKTLLNIQTPSLAAYIPAYKLLTIKNKTELEIETIVVDTVERYNELFELYQMEHDYLKTKNDKNIWDETILKSKSYHEFTDYHLTELVRLRFLPDDWPANFKNFLCDISGDDLLVLANIESNEPFEKLLSNKTKYKKEWTKALYKTKKQLSKNHIGINDLKTWKGIDMITDFYRIRSADRLAIKDIGTNRINQYLLIYNAFYENKRNTSVRGETYKNTGLFLSILYKFLNGAPAVHFKVNLKTGIIENLDK